MVSKKKKKDLNAKKIGPTIRFPCLLTCSKQAFAYGTCHTDYTNHDIKEIAYMEITTLLNANFPLNKNLDKQL